MSLSFLEKALLVGAALYGGYELLGLDSATLAAGAADGSVSVADALANGASVSDLVANGASVGQMLGAGVDVSALVDAGVGAGELLNAGATVPELLSAGFDAGSLLASGADAGSLLQAGVSAGDILGSGMASVGDLLSAGASVPDLVAAGANAGDLLSAGASVGDLVAAGADAGQLLDAGASVSSLLDAGASTMDLIHGGASLTELADAGASVSQLGLDASQLLDSGMSLSQLAANGIAPETLLSTPGVSLSQIAGSMAPGESIMGLDSIQLQTLASQGYTTSTIQAGLSQGLTAEQISGLAANGIDASAVESLPAMQAQGMTSLTTQDLVAASQGQITPAMAEQYGLVANTVPANTIPVSFEGQTYAFDPATNQVLNADGSINQYATQQVNVYGQGTFEPTQVASNTVGQPVTATDAGGGVSTNAPASTATAPTSTATAPTGQTAYKIPTSVNLPSLSTLGTGALQGAGVTAAIDVVTGKPITAQGLLTGAATGAIGAGINTYLPSAAGSVTQAAMNGAVSAVGAGVIVDVGTGQPITGKSIAVQALTGGAIGGATGLYNNYVASQTPTGNGLTTTTYDDGSSMTTDAKGNPVTVTDTSGETTPVGIKNPSTGTTTQTFDDGSTVTTNSNGDPVSVTDTNGKSLNPMGGGATETSTTTNSDGSTTKTYSDGSTVTTNGNGDVLSHTPAVTPATPIDTSGAGATTANEVAKATTAQPTTATNQWYPIPTYVGQALTNPGVNPGFIQPAQQYPGQPAGMDTYYWGQQPYAQTMSQLGQTNPAAPATPYGNPNAQHLGQLITPEQLGYPNPQSMAAAQGTANPIAGSSAYLPNMSYDIYHNPVQMNTTAPAIPGVPNSYGPTTQAMAHTGMGAGTIAGQNLNYINTPAQLQPTPSSGTVAPGTFTAISPSDLQAQLVAEANAAGGH